MSYTLTARVDRLIYSSDTFNVMAMTAREVPDTSYVKTGKPFRAAGSVINPKVGQLLVLNGQWEEHPKFGLQFTVVSAEGQIPENEADIVAYLGSGMIKGIGESTAKKIVEVFGPRTMDVIHNKPEELLNVKGISDKKLKKIVDGCIAARKYEEITKFLRPYGISLKKIKAIYELFGDKSVKKIKENPYNLTWELEGIGFKTADKIAYACGIKSGDSRRIQAGVEYLLETSANEGHTYLPVDRVDETLPKLLSLDMDHVSYDDIAAAIAGCIKNKHVTYEDDDGGYLYLTPYYEAEIAVANKISLLMSEPRDSYVVDIARVEKTLRVVYAGEQKKVISDFPKNGITVLTGGPGTGKTTVVRGILEAYQGSLEDVILAAPTGKAAKRLQMSTGIPAKTIHRVLGAQPKAGGGCTFEYNEKNPLPAKLIIIDESSMINLRLAKSLFDAIKPTTQVVLVGDADQLPAIGAGNVYRELIKCGKLPVYKLVVLFRQGKDSNIAHNAMAINKGLPMRSHRFGDDFEVVLEKEPAKLQRLVIEQYKAEIRTTRAEEVQILTPRRQGSTTCANELNALIQAEVNPPRPGAKEMKYGERVFRAGDRIMQIRNNYLKDVYNGDTGTVMRVFYSAEDDEDVMEVKLDDGRYVIYSREDLEDLDLSYATTIHKSQGSEYQVVICPFSMQHYIMLKRNLLYTAITRAKRRVVIVGDAQAVATAIRNNEEAMRYTKLGKRI